jgi:hypothetical protein
VARNGGYGRRDAALARLVAAVALAALALGAACTGEESPSASGTSTSTAGPGETAVATDPGSVPTPTVDSLPGSVQETRATILDAATAGDYDTLEPVVDSQAFLSDAGFGVDPVPRWRDQGTAPLEAMAVLLAMPPTVLETNEGTLYQWPRFTAESAPEDMSTPERNALVALLGEPGLEAAFGPETGYVAPRLGILADGTWWLFVMEAGPRAP